jgi:hypothetical protein
MGSMASGEVRYLSYTRGVAADGAVWPVVSQPQSQSDTRTSDGLGTFDERASVTVNVAEQLATSGGGTMPNSVTAFAEAWQQSNLSPDGMTSTGRLDYYTSESYLGNGVAGASSEFAVQFALDTPQDYLIYFTGGVRGEIAKLVCETTGNVYDFSLTRGGSGVLDAGVYTLEHSINYGNDYHGSSLPVNFGMVANFAELGQGTVPEPGAVGLVAAGVGVSGLRRRRASSVL